MEEEEICPIRIVSGHVWQVYEKEDKAAAAVAAAA